VRYVLCILVAMVVTIGLAHAGEFTGGVGDCQLSSFASYCEWEPSDCTKPPPPSFFVTDAESYNEAVEEFNSYLANVQAYERCVTDEAEQDIKTNAPSMIADGAKKQIDDASQEVQRTRNDLESMRPVQ